MIRRSVQVVSKMVGKLRSEIEEKKLLVDTAKSCIAADAAAIVDLVRCRQREIDLLSKIQKWSGLISCSESVNWAIRQEMEEVLKQ